MLENNFSFYVMHVLVNMIGIIAKKRMPFILLQTGIDYENVKF